LLSFCSATICQKIKADGGLELLINTVKDPNTPVKQLEKVLGINTTFFFLEHVGELRIIVLIEEESNMTFSVLHYHG